MNVIQEQDSISRCSSVEDDDAELEGESGLSPLLSDTKTAGDVLSVKQLVLRRGLTLLVMIFILIAGIVTSDSLIKHLKS